MMSINQEESLPRSAPLVHLAEAISDDINMATTTAKPIHDHASGIGNVKTFDELCIRDELLHGVYSYGYETPSPIQKKAIVPILAGRDVIMQAQSGTGKTAAFSIGLLDQIDVTVHKCQALILSPTRELALQTYNVVTGLSQYMTGIKTQCLMGGTSINDEARILRSRAHVVSCTPGRLLDHIERGNIIPKSIKVIVLDECDRILSAGFQEQIKTVFGKLPSNVQAIIVSATLNQSVLRVADEFMRDPVEILVPRLEVRLEGILQYYVDCERSDLKLDVLYDLYCDLNMGKSMIFCNTVASAERLGAAMQQNEFSVSVVHGELSQAERTQRMKDFRGNVTRVLISTDVLSHGIDVQQVSIVVNYDMTPDFDNYIHRIGRAGRQGRKGVAINLLGSARDHELLSAVGTHYRHDIKELPADINRLLA